MIARVFLVVSSLGLCTAALAGGKNLQQGLLAQDVVKSTPLTPWADVYFTAFDEFMMDQEGKLPDVTSVFDEKSTISWQSKLPAGGTYTGPKEVRLFLARMKASILLSAKPTYKVLLEDTARGKQVVECTLEGTFLRSGNPFRASLKHLLTWDIGNHKIISHLIKTDSPAQLEPYMVRGEELAVNMLAGFYKSDSPINADSPWVKDYIADEFTMVMPKTEIFDKENWTKEELFPPVTQTSFGGSKSEFSEEEDDDDEEEDTPTRKLSNFKREVIYADNDKVLVQVDVDSFTTAAGTEITDLIVWQLFEFNGAGKLAKETVTFSRELHPWETLPRPTIERQKEDPVEEFQATTQQQSVHPGRNLLRFGRGGRIAGRSAARSFGRTVGRRAGRHVGYGGYAGIYRRPVVVAPVPVPYYGY